VRIVHQAEDPGTPVGQSLAQTDPDTGCFLTLSSVGRDALVSKLAFGFAEPAGLEWVIRKYEERNASDPDGKCALNQEQPDLQRSVSIQVRRGIGIVWTYQRQPARPWVP
jgi:hypothetical protein